MKTAIIGGGIAGLAAAYELEKARAAGAPVEYTLFESADRLGGSLASEIVDGAVLERGPDSFLTEKQNCAANWASPPISSPPTTPPARPGSWSRIPSSRCPTASCFWSPPS